MFCSSYYTSRFLLWADWVYTNTMMMIYIIHAANSVGIIEVPLGANVIPKGTALGYSVNISLCILHTPFYGRTL